MFLFNLNSVNFLVVQSLVAVCSKSAKGSLYSTKVSVSPPAIFVADLYHDYFLYFNYEQHSLTLCTYATRAYIVLYVAYHRAG